MMPIVELAISIALLLGAILIIFLFFLSFISNVKLNSYLKKNNIDRWRYLTSIGQFGPGCSNIFKLIKYLYSDIDNNDSNIRVQKKRIRNYLTIILYVLIFFFIFFIALAILWKELDIP